MTARDRQGLLPLEEIYSHNGIYLKDLYFQENSYAQGCSVMGTGV